MKPELPKPLLLAFNFCIMLLLLAYPFAVYYGLQHWQPKAIAYLLIPALLIRLALFKNNPDNPRMATAGRLTILGGLAVVSLGLISNDADYFRLYPVAINLIMLAVFALSLRYPPSVIESFAIIYEPDIDSDGLRYARKATIAWCLFFLANASIAAYTCFFASLEVWTWYNGFIAYIAMGLFFAGELTTRAWVKHQKSKAG